MSLVLTVIIVIISILLVGIVLLQKSKGGGLASGFQSSNQIMGAPKTANFLEKATWTLMGVIAVLCIICTLLVSNTTTHSGSVLIENTNTAPGFIENTPVEDAPIAPAEPAEN